MPFWFIYYACMDYWYAYIFRYCPNKQRVHVEIRKCNWQSDSLLHRSVTLKQFLQRIHPPRLKLSLSYIRVLSKTNPLNISPLHEYLILRFHKSKISEFPMWRTCSRITPSRFPIGKFINRRDYTRVLGARACIFIFRAYLL